MEGDNFETSTHDSSHASDVTDDDDDFTLCTIETDSEVDYDDLSSVDSVELELAGLRSDVLVDIAELAQGHENLSPDAIETLDGRADDDLTDADEDHPTNLTTRSPFSIAHKYFEQNRVVFISLDLETGGPKCGICQLSATFFDQNGNGLGEDFDQYVRPPDDAIWQKDAVNLHGLSASDDRIQNASPIDVVWKNFVARVEQVVTSPKRGVFVAWNGKSCDMEWIYRITLGNPEGGLKFPKRCQFFLDPYKAIGHYKSCELHPANSGLQDLHLGSVYEFIKSASLENAHNSLFDCRAQAVVLFDERFKDFRDRPKSISLVDDIWDNKVKNRAKQEQEKTRKVHSSWKADGEAATWEIPTIVNYESASGGPVMGPTSYALQACRDASNSLAALFVSMFTLPLLTHIANQSNKYANKDFVVPVMRTEGKGKRRTKRYKSCGSDDDNKTHRSSSGKSWEITVGYLLSWIGILLLHGAHKTDRSINLHWSHAPYGWRTQYVVNTMTRDAFQFLRRFLHFEDNTKVKPKSDPEYDPLLKTRHTITTLSDSLSKWWKAGERVVIDESMIKYKGKAVAFVQFMPAKPVKHGIKVYALCCAETGVLLSFEIYTGRDNTSERGMVELVERLITKCALTNATGRILYSDNYYTSVNLARHLYEKHKWLFVGTYALKDRKASRGPDDYPFHKLSPGAINSVVRGWSRRATREYANGRSKADNYTIQATTWRDKKQVGFLHTHLVGPNGTSTTHRHVKGSRTPIEIACPPVQKDYAAHFNGVDRNDRDSADYPSTIKTNRWYIRIFFWCLDRVVHTLFVIVVTFARSHKDPNHPWKKYLKRKNARYEFQVDLALDLIEYGIRHDWKDVNDESTRPAWMTHASHWEPCNCKKCFFCKTGKTHGITHKPQQSAPGRKGDPECSLGQHKIQNHTSYCRLCYRKRREEHGEHENAEQSKKKCNYSNKGCTNCKKAICEECWEEYEHDI